MKNPDSVLLIKPIGFKVVGADNVHMINKSGELNQIDQNLALSQWYNLKKIYENIGLNVIDYDGKEELPDAVFCANPIFSFYDDKERPCVILSNMKFSQRKNESNYLKGKLSKSFPKIDFINLNNNIIFEGMGDALIDYSNSKLYLGYGFRTDSKIIKVLEELLPFEIIPLELINDKFYHLDTCFSILDKSTVAVVVEAFNDKGLKVIKSNFSKVLEIDLTEAVEGFAGNCHCPDGKNVIVQKGNSKFNELLQRNNFIVHETDTSEFIKSGGSVFCMKHMLCL